MPKVALGFKGCKINRYDIQALSESLEILGIEITQFSSKADCYVINTCTVTSKADVSSRQLIRRSKKLSPEAKIVVTGCYAQMNSDELSELGIDLVISNSEKETVSRKVAELFGIETNIPGTNDTDEFGSFIISGMDGMTRGFIKIQEGCDRKCTYCTIWKSRGPVRSRNPKFIIDEINNLYRNNYKEIALTGVHIGKYNYDDENLTDLISTILTFTDIPRIRLSSMYPTEIDDRFVRLIPENPRICPHIHLSIQSGDDEILELMGRKYTREKLFSVISSLKNSVPDITIGGDIIVGFPGENESRFKNSFDLIEQAGVQHLHVFPFSARPGTKAAEMKNIVPEDLKQKRARTLRELGKRLKSEHLKSYIDRDVDVLIENRSDNESGFLTGLSPNYLRVNGTGDKKLKGQIVEARPYSIKNNILIANLTEN